MSLLFQGVHHYQHPVEDRERRASTTIASLIDELLHSTLVLLEDWQALPEATRQELRLCGDRHALLPRLVGLGLLTEYQAIRIEAGKTFGLMVGNYRILDRLGAGGMGVVFRAEHTRLRRQVAIKCLAMSLASSEISRLRFDTEMRAIAQLQHPNIVTALDAGDLASPDATTPAMHYFVMEYVPGQDLEQYVLGNGPMPVVEACDVVYQIASALAEAHKHQLVHRDLKPSNVQRMPEGRVKLLDFGLAQHVEHRMTEPGAMLGTVEYMAPEQAQDASCVDHRVDIYGLGGTLFWCLTGEPPFPVAQNTLEGLIRRQHQPPPSVRKFQPRLPAELDNLVMKMMATKAGDRFATAQAVMCALLPFLRGELNDHLLLTPAQVTTTAPRPASPADGGRVVHKVLLVDDESSIRQVCRLTLMAEDVECDDASDGLQALSALEAKAYDLLLLDVMMPGLSGFDVCKRVRSGTASPHVKIIMFSGQTPADEMAQALSAGADDYLTKPFSTGQLRARVRAALRLKAAQDRAEMLTQHLMAVNRQLEQHLTARDSDLVEVRDALVLALAKLVGHRDIESLRHLTRLQRYCRVLAEECARFPTFAGKIDPGFIEMLEYSVPLHDIGKVALPDHILHKPGKLDPDERVLMQTHAIIGSDLLRDVATEYGSALTFLQMAIDVTRHHHERWDGEGYPDRLAGADIPLSARMTCVADVYDALRCHRVYKPALAHATALHVMLNMPGQFDPALMQAFHSCHAHFERIFREVPD